MIIQDNPFQKSNPFKLNNFQKFEHPYLPSQKNQDHQHLIYHQHRPLNTKILENNWTFNEDNLSKKHDFSRKQNLTNSTVSQFQMKIKMANIGIPHQSNKNNAKAMQGKLENPFYRKSLLVSKEDVMNQVELDVNLYKNRTKSAYQTVNVPSTYSETPVLVKKRISVQQQQEEREYKSKSVYVPQESPLSYSKTPKVSLRISERLNVEQAGNDPETIVFKGKQFFLN